MSQRFTYTSSRLTLPDDVALLAAVRAIDATAGVTNVDATFTVKTSGTLTAQAIANIKSAIDAAPAMTPQRIAQNYIDVMSIFEKAIILTLIDQINVLRTKAGLATVSTAQALQAIKDKAATL